MSEGNSIQYRLADSGELEPDLTWDGEPLWSTSSVQEGLFSPEAFEQVPGQTSMNVDAPRCTGSSMPARYVWHPDDGDAIYFDAMDDGEALKRWHGRPGILLRIER